MSIGKNFRFRQSTSSVTLRAGIPVTVTTLLRPLSVTGLGWVPGSGALYNLLACISVPPNSVASRRGFTQLALEDRLGPTPTLLALYAAVSREDSPGGWHRVPDIPNDILAPEATPSHPYSLSGPSRNLFLSA